MVNAGMGVAILALCGWVFLGGILVCILVAYTVFASGAWGWTGWLAHPIFDSVFV